MGTPHAADNLPFFVYGTLLPGQPNAYLWAPYDVTTRPARLPGARLHDMGHFPMLIEVAGGPPVTGALLLVPEKHRVTVTRLLDRLERYNPARPDAGLYRRRQRSVLLPDGSETMAWVYVGREETAARRPLVADGDWAAYTRSRQRELSRWWREHGGDYDSALHQE